MYLPALLFTLNVTIQVHKTIIIFSITERIIRHRLLDRVILKFPFLKEIRLTENFSTVKKYTFFPYKTLGLHKNTA